MKSTDDLMRLEFRLEEALRENRRFRERIEALASQNHHLRERVREAVGRPPEAVAFEEIGSPQRSIDTLRPQPESLGRNRDLSLFRNAWFPVFAGGTKSLNPSPGLRCLTAVRAPIRLGFQVFGLDTDRIEEAVSKVEERQLRERDFIPIFVTDNSDFSVIRSRGYVFEYIPPSIASAPKSQRAQQRILKERLELIRAKWSLRDIIDLSD